MALNVHLLYGSRCPDGVFRVAPSCGEGAQAVAPEWLLAGMLGEDGLARDPGGLALLLRGVKGPFTVLKAAAVDPVSWRDLLWASMYFSGGGEGCAALLPFAPSTSALAVLGRREACVDAYLLGRRAVELLVYGAAGAGVEELYLVNPPRTWLFRDARMEGPLGSYRAREMRLPRYFQALAGESVEWRGDEPVLEGGGVEAVLPRPAGAGDMLEAAFPGMGELAYTLLEGVEESGFVLSYRAFLEMAEQLGGSEGAMVGRRLVLYGYLGVRQAQVEPTGKGLYVLAGGGGGLRY